MAVQEAAIRDYCRYRHLDLEHVFQDVGVSGGTKIADREGGGLVLERAAFKPYCIVAYKLDRLFRSLADAVTTQADLDSKGTLLVMVKENIDLTTLSGRLLFHLLAAFAEFERGTIGERTREALKSLKDSGRVYSGRAPYGWDDDGAGNLIENREEQVALTWMRNLRTRGHTDTDIARQANDRCIPAKLGGMWRHSAVAAVLSKDRPPRVKAEAPGVDLVEDITPTLEAADAAQKLAGDDYPAVEGDF